MLGTILGGNLSGVTCLRESECIANSCVGGARDESFCINSEDCPPITTGEFDCTGSCYGVTPNNNWYPDCDEDGMADAINDKTGNEE